MFCMQCGKKIDDNAAVCEYCGGEAGAVSLDTDCDTYEPLSAEASAAPEEGAQPPIPASKRILKTAASVLLGILAFISLVVLIALLAVQPANIPEIVAKSDISRLLGEAGLDEAIIEEVNENSRATLDVDVDMYSLRDFLRRENVADAVSGVAEKYAIAIAERDFDYYLTSRDIISLLKTLAPDIRDEFGYRMTDSDYERIAGYLSTDVNLKDYRIGAVLSDAEVGTALPWLLLSVYPLIIAAVLCFLFIFNIFLLHQRRVRNALLTNGIVFISVGILCAAAGLLVGPLSGLLQGSGLYSMVRIISGVGGSALVSGLIAAVIGGLSIAAFILIRKNKKQYQSNVPSEKYAKVWYYSALAVNTAGLVICIIFTLLCLAEMPGAYAYSAGSSREQGMVSEFEEQSPMPTLNAHDTTLTTTPLPTHPLEYGSNSLYLSEYDEMYEEYVERSSIKGGKSHRGFDNHHS